jgi:endonuclease I
MEETILALLAIFQIDWKNQVNIYKSESSSGDWQQGSLCKNPIINANES